MIWHLWTTTSQIKGEWGRGHKEVEGGEAKKLNHLNVHRREKRRLAKIPAVWSRSTNITWLGHLPAVSPHPPSLETTVPKTLDAEVKAFTPTHSSVWAMIIWLWLGCIKHRPAKDSPEVKAEGRQSAAPPTCASKDRTEPNGTPQEAAICLWIPFQKKKKKHHKILWFNPKLSKKCFFFFFTPTHQTDVCSLL